MKNSKNLYILINSLFNTNKNANKLNALYEFLRSEPEVLTDEQADMLIEIINKLASEKKEKSKNKATKSWEKRKKKYQDGFYAFKNKIMCTCDQCGEVCLVGDPVILQKEGGKFAKRYHLACAPAESTDAEMVKKYLPNIIASDPSRLN